jgi:hypothetical protein
MDAPSTGVTSNPLDEPFSDDDNSDLAPPDDDSEDESGSEDEDIVGGKDLESRLRTQSVQRLLIFSAGVIQAD